MRILFISSAHNSLSQRLLVELTQRGHSVAVCVPSSSEDMVRAAEANGPEVIIAPMLKTAIPEVLWKRYLCLIVHPGIKGDRGPSSLDWAIATGESEWGVTVLQAEAEMDAGPIWAAETFPMPAGSLTKSSVYRAQVTEAAVGAVLIALGRVVGEVRPEPLDYSRSDVRGILRPAMRQRDREIDWSVMTSDEIARRVRAADSSPGVRTSLLGHDLYVYGAHEEARLGGAAGQVIAQRHGAICVGTVDGAIWLTHAKVHTKEQRNAGIKLPAAQVLRRALRGVPHVEAGSDDQVHAQTYRDIRYWERGRVGYLSFDFYNGAMSTDQCRRLLRAFRQAQARPTDVICLLGGPDFWSNGIHLNVIEAAADPALESWRNINAIDDLVLQILTARQWTIAGLRGNAGAGGVMLALAADQVYARQGVILNSHYRSMGNLYGSEYWTYSLPRRVGAELAHELTTACQPIGTFAAFETGLIDAAFGNDVEQFERQLEVRATAIAEDPGMSKTLAEKLRRRRADERRRPLASYRAHELARMADNFFGPDPCYHEARHRFVHKIAVTRPVADMEEATSARYAA
jgi:putative two-component system protein, hydrogenase maturation factor HypX/HoxX